MSVFVIFGPPGSGKGTQAELLSKNLSLIHISVGDLLRTEISKKTELGTMAEEVINKGELLPDGVILEIVKSFLEHNKMRDVLLDGFPRTVAQANGLLKIMDEFGLGLPNIITLEIDSEEILKRLLLRAKIEDRADDTEKVIKKRIEVYFSQTEPVLEYFKTVRIPVSRINGVGDINDIQYEILDKI